MKPAIGSGDRGSTRSLAGGVRKADCLTQAAGDLDELNSALGLARSQLADAGTNAILRRVQGELFLIGADLSGAGASPTPTGRSERVTAAHVRALEADLQAAEAELPALSSFILPAGPGALLHVARATCRRAERSAFALAEAGSTDAGASPASRSLNPHALAYLNRLSDVLFALARLEAKRAGAEEEPWKP